MRKTSYWDLRIETIYFDTIMTYRKIPISELFAENKPTSNLSKNYSLKLIVKYLYFLKVNSKEFWNTTYIHMFCYLCTKMTWTFTNERVYVCLKRKGRLIGDGEIHPYRHPFESITKIAQSMNKHATTCATRKAKKHGQGPDPLMHELNFSNFTFPISMKISLDRQNWDLLHWTKLQCGKVYCWKNTKINL